MADLVSRIRGRFSAAGVCGGLVLLALSGQMSAGGATLSTAEPESAEGRIFPGDEVGGSILRPEAGWDGDFETFTEAASNGNSGRAITWETTEVYKIPTSAQNIQLHTKTEQYHYQSTSEVYVYNFSTGQYERLLLKEGTDVAQTTEETIPLTSQYVSNGEVRVQVVLFAKHSNLAYARYYDSEIIYTAPTPPPTPLPDLDTAWRHWRYDWAGTSYNPIGSTVRSTGPFEEVWSSEAGEYSSGHETLTGNILGDDKLEIVTEDGTHIRGFDTNGDEVLNLDFSGWVRPPVLSLLADVNGDGFDEIGLGGSPNTTTGLEIRFYDGSGNAVKTLSREGGYDARMIPVALLEDGDILVAYGAGYSRDPRGIGRWDYDTATELWYYDVGPAGSDRDRVSIADMDGDGKLEITLGSGTVHNGATGTGVDGRGTGTTDGDFYTIVVDEDGNERFTIGYTADGESNGGLLNMFVDLDKNGTWELLVLEHHDPTYYPGTSQIHLVDVSTHGFTHTFNGAQNAQWGASYGRALIADINGDGSDEIIVTQTRRNNTTNKTEGMVTYVFNSELSLIDSMSAGSIVCAANDMDGDGQIELIMREGESIDVMDKELNELWSFTAGGEIGDNVIVSDTDRDGKNEIILRADKLYVLEGTSSTPPPPNSLPVASLGQSSASAESEISIPLTLSDATGIAGGDLTITYDPSVLTIGSVTAGELLTANGITLIPNLRTTGKVIVSLAGATSIPSGQGTLLTLSFTVKPSAADGVYPVSFEKADLRAETGTLIPVTTEDGAVTVQSVVLGDVDGDGEITSGDAILTLRFAAELQEPTDKQRIAADVDKDGQVTAGDAILILRRAAALIDDFPQAGAARLDSRSIQADLSQIENEDGSRVLSLSLDPTLRIAGGDLLVTFDPALGRPLAVAVGGLPEDGLSMINTQTPGQIRASFARSRDSEQNEPLVLRLLLPASSPGKPSRIDLNGRLFNATGSHLGNLRLEQEVQPVLPSTYALLPNYPNPFNPRTTLRYHLPEPREMSLGVYNLAGQLIRTLVQGRIEPGYHTVEWDGRDDAGNRVSSGVYLYRIVVGNGRYIECHRMLLLK